MDLKSVIETSTEALTGQAEKVAANISPSLTHLAESPLGQGIASIVTKAGAKADEVLHNGDRDDAEAAATQSGDAEPDERAPAEDSSDEDDSSGQAQAEDDSDDADAPEPVQAEETSEPASTSDLVEAVAGVLSVAAADVQSKADSGELAAAVDAAGESGSGSHKALVIGGSLLAAGTAAAAAVVVYRRRKGAQDDEEGLEDTEGAVVTPITTASDGSAQEAETADKENKVTQIVEADSSFAHALDEEAEHFAQDFVDHIDDEDVVLDPEYTIEVDIEADHFAQELVDSIVVTDEDLAAAGEELGKQG